MIVSTTSWAKPQIYQMEDLEVLSAEQNYNEFFDHALDIKPAKRTKAWKEMVEAMGQSYLEEQLSLSKIVPETFVRVRNLSNWPIFKNNEFFIKKRDQIFLREITSCQNTVQATCLDLATTLYNDFQHESTFDYNFVVVINKLGASQQLMWKYTKDFVQKGISEFYCDKPVLKQVIRNQIITDFEKNKLEDLKINTDCVKSIAGDLKSDLVHSNASISKSSYETLAKYKLLSAEDKQVFHIMQFITANNLSTNTLDYSLNTLKNLAKNYQQREKLIKTYKGIDPLPDLIFGETKSSSISRIKILSRYFPELIDTYALTCLDYLDGSRTFPKGNPTPNCHKFFKSSKKHSFVPASFIKRYDKATYFMPKENI